MTTATVQAVSDFLEERLVRHDFIVHDEVRHAGDLAQLCRVAPQQTACTVVLHDGDAYRLAIVPARSTLDLAKLRHALRAGPGLRIARTDEIEEDFPAFEPDAVPPFGPPRPVPEVVDRRLLEYNRILCRAGDRGHSIIMDPVDLIRVTGAVVADVCRD